VLQRLGSAMLRAAQRQAQAAADKMRQNLNLPRTSPTFSTCRAGVPHRRNVRPSHPGTLPSGGRDVRVAESERAAAGEVCATCECAGQIQISLAAQNGLDVIIIKLKVEI
jgi:hypothetical protein